MTEEPPDPEVERLRYEIELIDRSIVGLLGARRRAQHRLLRWKEHEGRPLFDPPQEARVLSRAAAWALEIDVDPALATAVVRLALEAGKRAYPSPPVPPPAPEVRGRGSSTVPRSRRAPLARVNSG